MSGGPTVALRPERVSGLTAVAHLLGQALQFGDHLRQRRLVGVEMVEPAAGGPNLLFGLEPELDGEAFVVHGAGHPKATAVRADEDLAARTSFGSRGAGTRDEAIMTMRAAGSLAHGSASALAN